MWRFVGLRGPNDPALPLVHARVLFKLYYNVLRDVMLYVGLVYRISTDLALIISDVPRVFVHILIANFD